MALDIQVVDTNIDTIEGVPQCVGVRFTITDGLATYLWRATVPIDCVDIRAYLLARGEKLWQHANLRQEPVPAIVRARLDLKRFLTEYPAARTLITLPYEELLATIQTRTAAQESLLLALTVLYMRYDYAASLEEKAAYRAGTPLDVP